MVMDTTADPLFDQTGEQPCSYKEANINLVADFVSSLPNE